jgi:hypothetical protein
VNNFPLSQAIHLTSMRPTVAKFTLESGTIYLTSYSALAQTFHPCHNISDSYLSQYLRTQHPLSAEMRAALS